MILSLLYSLKNLDFFNISSTITNTDVLPFLITFLVLIPLFIFIEKKSEDPVMNLNYFTDKNIVLTLLISMLTGVIIMGMIFVPQFCENTMKVATGSGGYFVIILGLFSGVGAPVSGKLIDKFGAKLILEFGFLISIAGSLFLSFVATSHPSTLTVVISLILIGIGVGFTMGTPLNYMILSHTKESESNSAFATLSLVRSLGTAVAPAIMVGFIAHAGANIQDEIMKDLPNTITIPKLPYADEITKEFNDLKSNSQIKDKLKNMDMPDLVSMETVKIDFDDNNSDYKVADNVVKLMKTSDVTTITNNSKIMAKTMFHEMTPSVIKDIQNNVQKGIDGVDKGVVSIESSISKLNDGYNKLSTAYTKVNAGYNKLNSAYTQVNSAYIKMNESYIKANNAMKLAMTNTDNKQENMNQMGGDTASMASKLKAMKTKVNTMKSQVDTMKVQANNIKSQLRSMNIALTSMKETLNSIKSLEDKMIILKNSVPNAFDEGEKAYLKEIDNRSDQIENTFKKILNIGFKNVYLTTGISSIIGLLLLLFYKNKPIINNRKSN